MSYGVKKYDLDTRRMTVRVVHVTPGREGTRIETDVHLHLVPNAVEPGMRVSVLAMDLWEIHGATVDEATTELARVLERIAAGLREGPDGVWLLLHPKPAANP